MLHAALATALLLVAVATVVLPLRHVAWAAVPPALAAIALAGGAVPAAVAEVAARSLAAPLAFVCFAVPLAVLLDDLGYFAELAALVPEGPRAQGWLWLLAALVTAGLNLDASVVLLTPLYVRIARARGLPVFTLALQPALLSGLASSALPISNLTNLIAGSRLELGSAAFLVHLGLPTLGATLAGYVAYVLQQGALGAAGPPALPPLSGSAAAAGDDPGSATARSPAEVRRILLGGSVLVALLVTGFLAVPLAGGQPWEVAAGGDVLLVALGSKRGAAGGGEAGGGEAGGGEAGGGEAGGGEAGPAWRSLRAARFVPWQIVLIVLGLGVLASATALHLPLRDLVGGSSPAQLARTVGVATVASNAVNNLPALLVGLPGVSGRGWSAWALLTGTNVGALFVPTCSLAVLLWMSTLDRLGVPVRQRHVLAAMWRVALPGLLTATALLVGLRALLGA